jgi:REP element-mobilizing transposase RayT
MEERLLYKNKYRIASTRLKFYDYSKPGAYFVTICTKNRAPVFGFIKDHYVALSWAGCIVHRCWRDLPNHYPNCILDEFIVMPDHIHGIIILTDGSHDPVETGFKPVSTKPTKPNKQHSLSEIIRGFKTFSAKKINDYQKTTGQSLWQTRFYEHVIREDAKMDRIRNYIAYNPVKGGYGYRKLE